MSISAIIPVYNLLAANEALKAAGHGSNNFSVLCYTGPGATHAALHCWDSPEFLASLQAIPAVTILSGLVDSGEVDENNDPILIDLDSIERTHKVIEDANAKWGAESSELPISGTVAAGDLYQLNNDLWYVIQSFNRSIYSSHPSTYPALIRRVRSPYAVEAWKQPLDQFDAYRLVNPFTGKPDQAIHNSQTWYVTSADGSGNNVWEPGVFGWTVVGELPAPSATWIDTGATVTGQAGQLYYLSKTVAVIGLTAGQKIKLGSNETTYVQTWPGTNNLIQINPYVAASNGTKLWKWA